LVFPRRLVGWKSKRGREKKVEGPWGEKKAAAGSLRRLLRKRGHHGDEATGNKKHKHCSGQDWKESAQKENLLANPWGDILTGVVDLLDYPAIIERGEKSKGILRANLNHQTSEGVWGGWCGTKYSTEPQAETKEKKGREGRDRSVVLVDGCHKSHTRKQRK